MNQYDFTASAGEQVQLDVISVSGGVEFDLTGPGGYTAFTDSPSGSGLITLPSTGSYVLTAHGNGAEGGSYAFELEQTSVTDLTLGTPYSGTLAGSGQAQLFEVSVPATQALVVTLQDSSTDVNQVYASLGSPPTPGDYAIQLENGVDGQPAIARSLGGAGRLVHPGLFRVGSLGQRVHAHGGRGAHHADHRRPRSVRRGEHRHVDAERVRVQQCDLGRAGLRRATPSTRPPA